MGSGGRDERRKNSAAGLVPKLYEWKRQNAGEREVELFGHC
jgi:hypothetical protein